MAIDVCSEIPSSVISPRISFSHDLDKATDDFVSSEDCHPRLDSCLLDPDFNFCIGNTSLVQEISPADELFSDGKILPTEIKKQQCNINTVAESVKAKSATSNPSRPCNDNAEKKQLKEFLSTSLDADDYRPASRSFWQFRRSNSLNCDSSRNKGLIRSSLQFLSRSYSTGSAPNPPNNQSTLAKETQKPQLQKQSSVPGRKSSASNFGVFHSYNSSQKPPTLRKCGSYGNGVRISPVLNIPSPYISSGTVNLFGFGSLFCNGKVKRKKR